MPNFRAHRALGWIAGLFVFAMAFLFTLLTTFALDHALMIGITAFSCTIVGSIIPDIDQSRPEKSLNTASIPYRGLINVLRGGLVFAGFVIILNISGVSSTIELILVLFGIVAGVFLFARIPDILHSRMPKHRGLTHQTLPWVVFAVGGTIFLRYFLVDLGATDFAVAYLPSAIAIPLSIGAICHISLDIVVSLWRKL